MPKDGLRTSARLDGEDNTPSLTREITMRIFYASELPESGTNDNKDRDICQAAELYGLTAELSVSNILLGDSDTATGAFFKGFCDLDSIRVTATADAEPGSQHPILLFSSGLGGVPHEYTFLLQEMARRGFIVVAISHTCLDRMTIINEKIFLAANRMGITETADAGVLGAALEMEDARAVLDKLEVLHEDPSSIFYGKLDMKVHDGVGYFGHSLGGLASMLTAVEEVKSGENRIRACINMDGKFNWGGRNSLSELGEINKPFMLLGSPFTWVLTHFLDGWQAWSSLAPGSLALSVSFSQHNSFTDICAAPKALLKEKLSWPLRLLFSLQLCGWIDPNYMHQVAADYTSAFFRLHLLGDESAEAVLQRRRLTFFTYHYRPM